MQRTRNALLVMLFIASTLVAALHELSPVHEADGNCPVCLVQVHSVAACAVGTEAVPEPVFHAAPTAGGNMLCLYRHTAPSGSRDPPDLF